MVGIASIVKCSNCGETMATEYCYAGNFNHECPECVAEVVHVYMTELKEKAANGDQESIDALTGMNQMFPDG